MSAEAESCVLPGQKVWTLTASDGDVACLPGVFSSKERALQALAEDWIGEEEAAAIVWMPSPHNPEYFEGREPSGKEWLLVSMKVDEI